MHPVRPAIAHDPRHFGRAVARAYPIAGSEAVQSSDLKLFLTTFAAGFLFVSVLIA